MSRQNKRKVVVLEFSSKHELSQKGGERQCTNPEGPRKILKGAREWSKILLRNFCAEVRYITYVSRVRRLEGALQFCVGGQILESNREETVSGFCWNYYICNIFMIITILLHVVIVNLKLYHFNKEG